MCTISDRTSRKLKYLHHPRELYGDLLNYALDFPSSCLVNNCTHTWAYLHTSWYTSTTMLLPILFITSKRQVGLFTFFLLFPDLCPRTSTPTSSFGQLVHLHPPTSNGRDGRKTEEDDRPNSHRFSPGREGHTR